MPDPHQTKVVILFGGVAKDGGGIGWDGHHFFKIPPWDPGVREALQTAQTLTAAAATIPIKAVSESTYHAVEEVLTPVMPRIMKQLEK